MQRIGWLEKLLRVMLKIKWIRKKSILRLLFNIMSIVVCPVRRDLNSSGLEDSVQLITGVLARYIA